jgi:mono/diheme cytochrome c family protein
MIQVATLAAALTLAATLVTAADAQAPRSGPPPIPPELNPFPPLKAPPGTKAANPGAPSTTKGPFAKSVDTSDNSQVSRGQRLVDSHDCHACHTPMKMGTSGPEPDMSLALSGHPQKLVMPPPPKLEGPWGWVGSSTNTAFAGPWGISYAVNLTPDPDTGIGNWQEHEFVQAIKTGKHLGVGRPIMPPMPWPAYRNLNDQQLRAIFAYLKSVTPIKNKVPDYAPPK